MKSAEPTRTGWRKRVPPCPHCAHPLDGFAVLTDLDSMRAGARVLCAHCLGVAICERVTRLGRPVLRAPTQEEHASLIADALVCDVKAALVAQARISGRELHASASVVPSTPGRTLQ